MQLTNRVDGERGSNKNGRQQSNKVHCDPILSRGDLVCYCKVASYNTPCLKEHESFFRLLMEGILDPYVLSPFDKKLI